MKHVVRSFFAIGVLVSSLGFRLSAEEATPRTNFYRWANRDWLSQTTIPNDQPRVDNFTQIQDKVYDQLKDQIMKLPRVSSQSEEGKLTCLYDGFIDLDRRNQKGFSPLKSDLKAVRSLKTHRQVVNHFAFFQSLGIPSPLVVASMADFKDSSKNIAYILQAGLGLERDYYLGTDPQSQKQLELYKRFLTRLFQLASVPEAETKVKDVLALETNLAKIQWSRVENRNMEKVYNPETLEEYFKKTEKLYGSEHFSALGVPSVNPVCVMQPSYVAAYADLFQNTSVDSWKNYLTARLLARYSNLLTADFKKALVDYEIGLGLYTEEKPLWKQGLDYLTGTMGMAVGRVYVTDYFEEGMKTDLTKMVLSIRDEYKLAITHAQWLSGPTKTKALEKLEKMEFKIGYPDRWKDYSGLTVKVGDAVGNDQRVARFEHVRSMQKIGQPVDKNDWEHAPHEINAFYDPTSNSFNLLAGILHDPFYVAHGDLATLYGGIGFVVGHEIGHGFDDQGSRFDGDGNLVNWWSEADNKAYENTQKKIIAQANAYEILPGTFLKGEQEIGEIMGDLSGSQIAFGAYKKALESTRPVTAEDERTFFIQLAKTWRSQWRDDVLRLVLQSDPHPPSEFRTNGIVKQFPEFHKAFNVRPGDKMYLAPEKRVLIW